MAHTANYPTRKPRQPKALKLPKRPKQSASANTWLAYEKRCEDVARKNRERQKEYVSLTRLYEAGQQKKAAVQKRASRGLAGFGG